MFDQIKAALDLRKELPDAVGYDTYGPITFPLPQEIHGAIPQSIAQQLDNLTLVSVRIDNYSSKTQRNIRVLFSGDWEFAPRFSFHRRDVEVKSKILTEDKEIILLEVPPNESVSIEIFNPSRGFRIDRRRRNHKGHAEVCGGKVLSTGGKTEPLYLFGGIGRRSGDSLSLSIESLSNEKLKQPVLDCCLAVPTYLPTKPEAKRNWSARFNKPARTYLAIFSS